MWRAKGTKGWMGKNAWRERESKRLLFRLYLREKTKKRREEGVCVCVCVCWKEVCPIDTHENTVQSERKRIRVKF
jgi:hypothetical protein